MPYFITDKHPDCTAWATVKADGELVACHSTKQAAINQMVAVSLAEKLEPGGDYKGSFRSIETRSPQAIILDIDGTLINNGLNKKVWEFAQSEGSILIVTGRPESRRARTEAQLKRLGVTWTLLRMNDGSTAQSVAFKKRTAEELLKNHDIEYAVDDNPDARQAYSSLGIEALSPGEVPEPHAQDDPEDSPEERAVSLTAPAFMRANARRGLRYYEDGKGGDGLVEKTIREAREMASGRVSEDKWMRIRAWIARHMSDLDSPNANPSSDGYPSAGVVAHLLWGSNGTKEGARRTMEYADRIIARLEEQSRGNPSVKADMKSKIETRMNLTNFEIRESNEGMIFEGYAAVFNSPSQPLPFIERIAPGAFSRTLRSRNEIKLLWNHDSSEILGSTRAGTLTLEERADGLFARAVLPNTTRGRDTAELLRRGDVNAMSFGFTVPPGGDEWNADGSERILRSIRLHEVSIVGSPAYLATTANVRALDSVATRAEVNADSLQEAILKIEDGQELTSEEGEMLRKVVDSLTPKSDEETPAQEEQPSEELPDNESDKDVLEIKRKKLELLLKGL